MYIYICTYTCMYMPIKICRHACIHVYIYIHVYLYTYIYIYVYMKNIYPCYVHLFIYPTIHPSVYLSICALIYLNIRICIYVSVASRMIPLSWGYPEISHTMTMALCNCILLQKSVERVIKVRSWHQLSTGRMGNGTSTQLPVLSKRVGLGRKPKNPAVLYCHMLLDVRVLRFPPKRQATTRGRTR